MTININQLANEINKSLAQYANGVGEEVEAIAQKIVKDGAKRLKMVSPEKTGDYRKGWRAKKVDNTWIVHNATDYQLTHLLEKGHAKVGGGRVSARVHIEPVEQEMIKEFTNGVEGAIRG